MELPSQRLAAVMRICGLTEAHHLAPALPCPPFPRSSPAACPLSPHPPLSAHVRVALRITRTPSTDFCEENIRHGIDNTPRLSHARTSLHLPLPPANAPHLAAPLASDPSLCAPPPLPVLTSCASKVRPRPFACAAHLVILLPCQCTHASLLLPPVSVCACVGMRAHAVERVVPQQGVQ